MHLEQTYRNPSFPSFIGKVICFHFSLLLKYIKNQNLCNKLVYIGGELILS